MEYRSFLPFWAIGPWSAGNVHHISDYTAYLGLYQETMISWYSTKPENTKQITIFNMTFEVGILIINEINSICKFLE